MTYSNRTSAIIGAIGIAALAAMGYSTGAESGQDTLQGSRDCRIISTENGGMLHLAASFTAPSAMTGEYHFSVTGSGSSGSSQISQGNAFRAGMGETLTLGSVSLSPGKIYDARLKIVSEAGEIWQCRGTFDF